MLYNFDIPRASVLQNVMLPKNIVDARLIPIVHFNQIDVVCRYGLFFFIHATLLRVCKILGSQHCLLRIEATFLEIFFCFFKLQHDGNKKFRLKTSERGHYSTR